MIAASHTYSDHWHESASGRIYVVVVRDDDVSITDYQRGEETYLQAVARLKAFLHNIKLPGDKSIESDRERPGRPHLREAAVTSQPSSETPESVRTAICECSHPITMHREHHQTAASSACHGWTGSAGTAVLGWTGAARIESTFASCPCRGFTPMRLDARGNPAPYITLKTNPHG